MKKSVALVSSALLLSLSLSLFSCYPARVAPEAQDADDEASTEIEEIVSAETSSMSSSTKRAALFMKVNSNYMLNKNTRAAIYDRDGFIYGSPYKINGVVYVPIKPIITDYLGGSCGWDNNDGTTFLITDKNSTKVAVVAPGSANAVYNGTAITLDYAPLLVKGEGCDKEYLVVAISDVEKLISGIYVTYDEMGLIGISSSKNIFNRDSDLKVMVELMTSFIYDFSTTDELLEMMEENTNNFDHPYLIVTGDSLSYMRDVYNGVIDDPTYKGWLDGYIEDAEGYFERFTTLPDKPANPDYTVKACETNPQKYEYLAVEITNPYSGIKEGELWTNKSGYMYAKTVKTVVDGEEVTYYYPSKLGDSDNGAHFNAGYDYDSSESRECSKYAQYILHFALSYLITEDEKYASIAYDMMVSLCDKDNWYDWSHAYFLAVGETMTHVGLAYDWLYDAWVEIQNDRADGYKLDDITKTIYDRVYVHSFETSEREMITDVWVRRTEGDSKYSNGTGKKIWNWSKCEINWNCVCNSGLVLGAMAIVGEEERLGVDYTYTYTEGSWFLEKEYTVNAVEWTLTNNFWRIAECGLAQYAPDGSYIESPGYWSYATTYLSFLLAAIPGVYGDDLGFYETWGMDKTFYFAIQVEYPCIKDGGSLSYKMWKYNDCNSDSKQDTQSFLVAADFLNDSSLAAIRMDRVAAGDASFIDILKYKPEYASLTMDSVDLALDWQLESLEGVVTRSEWSDGCLYAGLMGNNNNVTDHGQTDSGNFIYANYNHTWFVDLGAEEYSAYECLGHSEKETTTRYRYYRNSAEGHNVVCLTSQPGTLNENPNSSEYGEYEGLYSSGQYHKGGGVITTFESCGDAGMYTVLDNTTAYGDLADYAYRGMLLTNSRQTVVIQDQIKFKSVQSIVWIGHTEDAIYLTKDGKEAYLTSYINGQYRQLRVSLVSDNSKLKFEVISAGNCEEDFLLPGTHRSNFSTDKGYLPEYSRSRYKRLIIRAENVVEFNCAVVMEMIGLNQESAPLRYDYTDMVNWAPVEDDVSYADNITIDKTSNYETELKTQSSLAIRYINEDGLFSTSHSALFVALINANMAQKQLSKTQIESRDDVKEAYQNFKLVQAMYNTARKDINAQLKISNPILNYATYYV